MGLDDPSLLIALISTTALQIILGIDNVVLVATLADNLPENQKKKAIACGMAIAMAVRIAMLLGITTLLTFTKPIFNVFDIAISIKDTMLISGGLLLLIKGVNEIHDRIEGDSCRRLKTPAKMPRVIAQIFLFDVLFSFDAVVLAVGMTSSIPTMCGATVLSVAFMIIFSSKVSSVMSKHPSAQILGLSFLFLIGVALISDGLGLHIGYGYIYFAMAFAAGVEALNIVLRRHEREASISAKHSKIGMVLAPPRRQHIKA